LPAGTFGLPLQDGEAVFAYGRAVPLIDLRDFKSSIFARPELIELNGAVEIDFRSSHEAPLSVAFPTRGQASRTPEAP
jgi:hypothetical protein